MKQLNPPSSRQTFILRLFEASQKLNNKAILKELRVHFGEISRLTLIRDMNGLVQKKLVRRVGKGRNTTYELAVPRFLLPFPPDAYFGEETDRRVIRADRINFSSVHEWNRLFSSLELEKIDALTKAFQERLDQYKKNAIQKEFERITIEFSWRSSHIEGNTYSLLDTERLLKEHREASGKTHHEAIVILNHKNALEYAWRNPAYFKKITLRKIEEVHTLIVKGLPIAEGLRKRPVGIVGTKYRPYDNVYQIREAMEALCVLINELEHPFVKAVVATAGLSYIQPFEDGNKRTSRSLGNAILLAHNFCPLSYRSIDEGEYKKAVILFYEQHSLFLFKKLFIEQYEFAVGNYFL